MYSMRRTTEQLIYQKTCQDEFDKFKNNSEQEIEPFSNKKEHEPFPRFQINRLVYSITYNDKISGLLSEYHKETENYVLGYNAQIRLYDYIDVSKIGNHTFTFNEAMSVIKQMRETVGPDIFYGAVIANKEHVDVNPLHPLVLNQFMRLTEKELEKYNLNNYSVIIYTFKDNWNKIRKKYPEKFEIKERYTKDILDLVMGVKFNIDIFNLKENIKMNMYENKFNIDYFEKFVDKNGKEVEINEHDSKNKYKQSYVIPGQILNMKGITYPYYGAIYVKGGRGWNLSPMWATNIDNPNRYAGKSVKKGSGICTKVGDSRTADGCKTLNHSNTTSERNDKTFTDGAMGYAQVAVDVSLSMFFPEYTGKKTKVIKKLTYLQFQKQQIVTTKKEYLMYLKNLMNQRMN